MALNPLIQQALAEQKPVGVNPLIQQALDEKKAVELSTQPFDKPVWNPDAPLDITEGTDNFDKFMAGVGDGFMNIAQGAGNMVGLVDDETIMDRKELMAPLGDTTAGSIGQFAGEVATLAPLGFIGKGAQVASGALKTKGMLPTAARILGGRAAPMIAEGAVAGTIAANPNERLQGAALGAGTAGALKMATSAGGRIFNRGIAETTDSAKHLLKLARKHTGRTPFIPAGQAIDTHAGPMSAKAGSFMDAASLLPSARRKMEGQASEFSQDMYETNLRQIFSGNKSATAVRVLKESGGDMKMAIEAGKNAGKGKIRGYTPTQEIVNTAAKGATRGQYTPKQLLRASEKSSGGGDVAFNPMRETALKMDDVMGKPLGTSNVAARDMYHSAGNLIGKVLDAVPGLGPALGSKSLQNFLVGNTWAQKTMQDALKTNSSQVITQAVRHIERAMVAQPAIDDESNDFKSLQDIAKGYGQEAATMTRGMMQ
tara:strand:- start:797 stop:2248 length:1452 start_codon:yes stop_codon:yes gene_type:complete